MGRQPRPPQAHLIALNFTVGRNSRLAGGGNEYHRVLMRTSHHPVLPVQKADSRGAGFLSASLCLCAHPIHLPFERTLLSSFYLEAALSCRLDYLVSSHVCVSVLCVRLQSQRGRGGRRKRIQFHGVKEICKNTYGKEL